MTEYFYKSNELCNLSRSQIDLFMECPRCFYLDKKLGIKRPGFPKFTLNIAVDKLLKKEFDYFRYKKEPHPFMKRYGINAIPAEHRLFTKWRDDNKTFRGIEIQYSNTIIYGSIDDLWLSNNGEYHIVDYKTTCKSYKTRIEKLEDLYDKEEWLISYKRQIEIYQWLLTNWLKDNNENQYDVSNTGYFVICNAIDNPNNRYTFEGKLSFNTSIAPYISSSYEWIEETIEKIKECLDSENIPEPSSDCKFCNYTKNILKTI